MHLAMAEGLRKRPLLQMSLEVALNIPASEVCLCPVLKNLQLLLQQDTEMFSLPLRAFIDLLETGSNFKAFFHAPIGFHISLKDYWVFR